MQENKRNKETSLFKKPQGFRTIRIRLTAEAIEWLGRTTKDDDGNTIGNHTLFYDLLSRMRLSPGRGDSFRRPQELQPGQFQFSETRLAEEWNIGRKRIRNLLATMERLGMIAVEASKTASVASMTCIEEWTDFQNRRFLDRHCRSRMDGCGHRVDRDNCCRMSNKGHYGNPDSRYDVLIRRRCCRADFAVFQP